MRERVTVCGRRGWEREGGGARRVISRRPTARLFLPLAIRGVMECLSID